MKTIKIIFCCFLFFVTSSVYSQVTFNIPIGNPAIIDGAIGVGEWTDADTTSIDLLDGRRVKVFYKHDNQAFYFLFAGPMGSYGMPPVFPEICFDVNNSHSPAWEADDWWFHVSATDCDNAGSPDVYTNCQVVQTDWQAAPNFSGLPYPDTVEIRTPFTKMGLNISTTTAIGISFMVASNVLRVWPAGASKSQPSTWAYATINTNTSINFNKADVTRATVFPNPSQGQLYINFSKPLTDNVSITVVDALGQKLQTTNNSLTGEQKLTLDLKDLPAGMYWIDIKTENNREVRKVILLH